jgi:hypothetical protein
MMMNGVIRQGFGGSGRSVEVPPRNSAGGSEKNLENLTQVS